MDGYLILINIIERLIKKQKEQEIQEKKLQDKQPQDKKDQ